MVQTVYAISGTANGLRSSRRSSSLAASLLVNRSVAGSISSDAPDRDDRFVDIDFVRPQMGEHPLERIVQPLVLGRPTAEFRSPVAARPVGAKCCPCGTARSKGALRARRRAGRSRLRERTASRKLAKWSPSPCQRLDFLAVGVKRLRSAVIARRNNVAVLALHDDADLRAAIVIHRALPTSCPFALPSTSAGRAFRK